MKLSKNNAGLAAEQLAATFLLNHGLKLVMQNYHCKFGEIDLIMQDGKTLVFVEVRLRTNSQFGSAAASITPHKQEKILRTAQHYLQQHGDCACRIDAILMDKANLQHIEWIHNAISA
ncbi:MAG TPA: YraN family protein [Methylotenera sp.]|nr:YraN family protein [Methylotenera sp.]HPH05924.1 YraN family protein [Methylotenera sp.]HPN00705.1 YraN family protein [Methylotenera sp.]